MLITVFGVISSVLLLVPIRRLLAGFEVKFPDHVSLSCKA
jgi:hypothetical protein